MRRFLAEVGFPAVLLLLLAGVVYIVSTSIPGCVPRSILGAAHGIYQWHTHHDGNLYLFRDGQQFGYWNSHGRFYRSYDATKGWPWGPREDCAPYPIPQDLRLPDRQAMPRGPQ